MTFYRVVRRIFLVVAAPLFRLKVEGRERIPREGPAVLIAAHRSWLDPPMLGAACPRPVRFLILERVYHWRPALRWFYKKMRALPVSPGSEGSLASLRTALKHLEEGELIGVFPEGRVVTDGPRHAYPGAALLAVRSGAPVIPVEIEGSDRAWPHRRPYPSPRPVRVTLGSPLPAPEGRGREAIERLAQQIEEVLNRRRPVVDDASTEKRSRP